MIIINEEIVGKELDKTGITSNQNALKLGIILIKYYKYIGLSNSEIKSKLLSKIHIDGDEDGVISDYIYNTLVLNINVCGEFRNSDIPITTTELELIHNLDNIKLEKFLFVMLVLCKVFNNNVRLSKKEIMRMSKCTESTRDFDNMFDILLNKGYIDVRISKYKIKENNKTGVFYYITDDIINLYKEEEIAFYVKNTNDPVLYYLWYYNLDNVVFCEDCNSPYIKSIKQTRGKDLCPVCRKNYRQDVSKRYMRKMRKNVSDQRV